MSELGSSVGDDGHETSLRPARWYLGVWVTPQQEEALRSDLAAITEAEQRGAWVVDRSASSWAKGYKSGMRASAEPPTPARPVPPVVPDSDDEVQPLERYAHVADEWDRTHLRNGFTDGYDQAVSDLENLRQGRNRVDVSESSFDDQQRGVALAIAHLRANASSPSTTTGQE